MYIYIYPHRQTYTTSTKELLILFTDKFNKLKETREFTYIVEKNNYILYISEGELILGMHSLFYKIKN